MCGTPEELTLETRLLALANTVSGGSGDIFACKGGAVERWRLKQVSSLLWGNKREEQRLEHLCKRSWFRSATNRRQLSLALMEDFIKRI